MRILTPSVKHNVGQNGHNNIGKNPHSSCSASESSLWLLHWTPELLPWKNWESIWIKTKSKKWIPRKLEIHTSDVIDRKTYELWYNLKDWHLWTRTIQKSFLLSQCESQSFQSPSCTGFSINQFCVVKSSSYHHFVIKWHCTIVAFSIISLRQGEQQHDLHEELHIVAMSSEMSEWNIGCFWHLCNSGNQRTISKWLHLSDSVHQ